MTTKDEFITMKMNEVKNHTNDQSFDMFELIGSIGDLFSSAYQTENIVSKLVINSLWELLLDIFLKTDNHTNRTTVLFVMSDILLYAKKRDIFLNLKPLKDWQNAHNENSTSSEIIECIDDMLL